MAILQETTGDTLACDGCGRTDAGPSQTLHISSYTVNDPNIGSAVRRHYCAGCAANRGITEPAVTIVGWEPSPVSALPSEYQSSTPSPTAETETGPATQETPPQ